MINRSYFSLHFPPIILYSIVEAGKINNGGKIFYYFISSVPSQKLFSYETRTHYDFAWQADKLAKLRNVDKTRESV